MIIRRLILALILPLATACSSASGVLEPGIVTLRPEVAAAVTTALQDEYHAEQTYRRVLVDFGTVLPFANIISAEQRHAASLGGILRSHNIQVPASVWNSDNVPTFASVAEACAVAAEAEVANIALYDALLVLELPADVRAVFTSNRRASLEAHLPAFNRCR